MTFEDYKNKRSLKRKYKQYNEALYHKDLRHMGIIRYNVKKIIKIIRKDKEPIDIHEIKNVSDMLNLYMKSCVYRYSRYLETKDEDYIRWFEEALEKVIEYIKSNYEIIEFLEYKEKMDYLRSRDSLRNKIKPFINRIKKEIDYFCSSSSSIDRFHDTSSGL